MRTVRVEASSAYDVLIGPGLLGECGARIAKVIPPCTAALVSDSNVAPLYAARVRESLETAGFRVAEFRFPAGERSKNLEVWAETVSFLAENRLGRGDFVAALGGGVTGDLAGFAASAYQRGIRCVQLPTTLLSAVDSSVGGKTAVDLPQGKNLVGSFHQPCLVLADADTLSTLPSRYITDGFGEIIKHGCIKSAELFGLIEEHGTDMNRIEELTARSIEIKAGVVERDEKESGERMLLNFGHTVGHAIEKCAGYTGIAHGEAVGVGMCVMARAGEAAGLTAKGTCDRIEAVLKKCGMPIACGFSPEEICEAAMLDKKRRGDCLNVVLLREIGNSFVQPIQCAEFLDFVRKGMGV